MKPKRAKLSEADERALDKMTEADIEYAEEHLTEVPSIVEGLGCEYD